MDEKESTSSIKSKTRAGMFRAPDGGQLAVVVCPRAIPADDAAPNAAPDASPDATPDPGAYDTPSQPLKPGQKRT